MDGAYIGLFYAPQGPKKPIKAFVLIQEHAAPFHRESTGLLELERAEIDVASGKIKTPKK
jgi:hypothetical protein